MKTTNIDEMDGYYRAWFEGGHTPIITPTIQRQWMLATGWVVDAHDVWMPPGTDAQTRPWGETGLPSMRATAHAVGLTEENLVACLAWCVEVNFIIECLYVMVAVTAPRHDGYTDAMKSTAERLLRRAYAAGKDNFIVAWVAAGRKAGLGEKWPAPSKASKVEMCIGEADVYIDPSLVHEPHPHT